MEFAPNEFVLVVYQLESVGSVTVHVPVAVGNASVAEQNHHLVYRFRSKREKIPEHIRILREKPRHSLYFMNKMQYNISILFLITLLKRIFTIL